MRIILVGAGVVGFHLAERLSVEGHDISVIDASSELVRRIDEKMNVLAVQGDASSPSVLRRAGTEGADLVIAVPDFWVDVTTLDDLDQVATAFRARHGHRLRIATKYHRLVREFMRDHGVAGRRALLALAAEGGARGADALGLLRSFGALRSRAEVDTVAARVDWVTARL